jgi:methyltransferase (TIGR00027 family)
MLHLSLSTIAPTPIGQLDHVALAPMPSSPTVMHVSDTALWVAMYRAMESERPDALFRDPYAKQLAGERGAEILNTMPKGRQYAWPMIVRTAVMDEIVLRLVREHGADAVLNLAAGLDTRPYRLDLPPSLHWVDADFPDMIDYKQGHLAGERPRCRVEPARVDLTDAVARQALFQRAGAMGTRVLVIAEGLLIYLRPEQAVGLARDLHGQPSFHWWLLDIASPALLRMMDKTWGRSVRAGGAPFLFAPAESTAFFRPHGWRETEFRSTFHEGLRLNRTFAMARFWNFVGRFLGQKRREEARRFAGTALLERDM